MNGGVEAAVSDGVPVALALSLDMAVGVENVEKLAYPVLEALAEPEAPITVAVCEALLLPPPPLPVAALEAEAAALPLKIADEEPNALMPPPDVPLLRGVSVPEDEPLEAPVAPTVREPCGEALRVALTPLLLETEGGGEPVLLCDELVLLEPQALGEGDSEGVGEAEASGVGVAEGKGDGVTQGEAALVGLAAPRERLASTLFVEYSKKEGVLCDEAVRKVEALAAADRQADALCAEVGVGAPLAEPGREVTVPQDEICDEKEARWVTDPPPALPLALAHPDIVASPAVCETLAISLALGCGEGDAAVLAQPL